MYACVCVIYINIYSTGVETFLAGAGLKTRVAEAAFRFFFRGKKGELVTYIRSTLILSLLYFTKHKLVAEGELLQRAELVLVVGTPRQC